MRERGLLGPSRWLDAGVGAAKGGDKAKPLDRKGVDGAIRRSRMVEVHAVAVDGCEHAIETFATAHGDEIVLFVLWFH